MEGDGWEETPKLPRTPRRSAGVSGPAADPTTSALRRRSRRASVFNGLGSEGGQGRALDRAPSIRGRRSGLILQCDADSTGPKTPRSPSSPAPARSVHLIDPEAEKEELHRRKVSAAKRFSGLFKARQNQLSSVHSFEDKIDLEQLKALKILFDEADADGGGDLDEQEFVAAFSRILGEGMQHDTLREWFMRIDANANGSVDWDEFSTYILLEGQQRILKDTVQAEYIGQRSALSSTSTHHTDMITQILVHPRNGRYYSCSRDGTVKAWRAGSLEHERIIYNGGSWVTDACLMKGTNRLMVCCADRTLVVLDCNTAEMLRVFAGRKHVRQEVRETVSVRPLTDRRKYGVALDMERTSGDTCMTGSRCSAEQLGDQSFGEFKQYMEDSQREKSKNKTVEVTTLKELTETPTAMEYFCSESEHQSVLLGLRDGAMQLYHLSSALSGARAMLQLAFRYTGHSTSRSLSSTGGCAISKLKLSKYLQGVISGSWDGVVKLTGLETGKVIRELRGHQKSVFSLDWSESLKIIATCGTERHVHIWNPFIPKPVFRLQGLSSSLVHVRINELDHQIITLSNDKCIKVWDVRTFRCMQTIPDNTTYHPENKLLALNYDPVRHSIVTGATYPVVWPMRKQATKFTASYTGHARAVVGAVVSYFNHVVTADAEMVYVWDLETGSRAFAFNAHRTVADQSRSGADLARLTTIAFDASGRRLLTGTHTGCLMMWNYINGQPLNAYQARPDASARGTEVQAIAHHVDDEKSSSMDPRGFSRLVCAALGSSLQVYPDAEQYTVKQTAEYVQAASSVGSPPTSPRGKKPESVVAQIDRQECDVYCVVTVKRLLALGLDSGGIQMYNPNTNNIAGRAMSVLTSPLSDGFIRRDGAAMVERRRRAPARRVEALLFLSAKSSLLLAATADGYVEFWNVRTRVLVHMMPPLGADVVICGLTANRNNTRLLLGSEDGAVTVCDIKGVAKDAQDVLPDDIRVMFSFQAHSERLTSLKWVEGYDVVLSSSTDCSVKLHSAEDGVFVGWFGLHSWDLTSRMTWQGRSRTEVRTPPTSPQLPPSMSPADSKTTEVVNTAAAVALPASPLSPTSSRAFVPHLVTTSPAPEVVPESPKAAQNSSLSPVQDHRTEPARSDVPRIQRPGAKPPRAHLNPQRGEHRPCAPLSSPPSRRRPRQSVLGSPTDGLRLWTESGGCFAVPGPPALDPFPLPSPRSPVASSPRQTDQDAPAPRAQVLGLDGDMDPRPRPRRSEARTLLVRRLEDEAGGLLKHRRSDPFLFPLKRRAQEQRPGGDKQQPTRRGRMRSVGVAEAASPADPVDQGISTSGEQPRAAPAAVREEEAERVSRHPGALTIDELDRKITQLHSLGFNPESSKSARDRRQKREDIERQRSMSPAGGGSLSARVGGHSQEARGSGARLCWSTLPCAPPKAAKLPQRDDGRFRMTGRGRSAIRHIDNEREWRARAQPDHHQETATTGGARRNSTHRSIGWTTAEIYQGVDLMPITS
eukprot:TRINITY_DN5079_c0_g1_i2.p1 TRINITY_DN5079_c0_g1~~TRINITY_DN5079_c0_g1_i2.p1  ORF type:complete len:1516 (+),score=483.91 TRINITY_DN5079_c0_g1_i2:49-4548(+)